MRIPWFFTIASAFLAHQTIAAETPMTISGTWSAGGVTGGYRIHLLGDNDCYVVPDGPEFCGRQALVAINDGAHRWIASWIQRADGAIEVSSPQIEGGRRDELVISGEQVRGTVYIRGSHDSPHGHLDLNVVDTDEHIQSRR